MAERAKITGLRQLRFNMLRLSDRMQRKHYAKAVRAAGLVVRNSVRSYAPIDTGELEASIRARAANRASNGQYAAKIGVVGPAGRYAKFQEFGTAHHAAQPFLAPGLIEAEGDAVNALKDKLKQGISDSVRGLK